MVKRLYVVLFGCSVAIAALTYATSCNAQGVAAPPKPAAKAAAPAQEIPGSENLLPASTKLWISVPNGNELDAHYQATRFAALANDPAIKPFVDSLRDQAQEWMKSQNFRLGVDLDELHDIDSGEICIAGVLRKVAGGKAKGSHGVVLLVDIRKTYDEAKKLQAKINQELTKNGAEIKRKQIGEVNVITSTIKRKRFRNSQSTHQAIVNKQWMLVSDNDEIFRDVLRNLTAGKVAKEASLAGQPAFAAVMKETKLGEIESQIRWFVDPFGYVQLAKALEAENQPNREPRDDWASILKTQGLGAAQAIGGNIALSTGEHELLHRTFTYAPREQSIENAKRMFELFNFKATDKKLTPPDWVPEDSSAYIIGNWEMTSALNGFAHVYDAFIGDEGSFARLLNDFKIDPDMQLDIKKLVGMIDNRFTMISASEKPITASSERIVLGFPMTRDGDPDFVFKSLERATGGEVIKLGGVPVIKVDSSSSEEETGEDPNNAFAIPDDDEDEDVDSESEFSLFEQGFFTVHRGHLLVANNKDYLKKILAQKKSKLSSSEDYVQVFEALGKMTDENKVGWRQFGRIDKVLETNYEMVRRGEMGKSQTVLAKITNQIFKKQSEKEAGDNQDKVRRPKLDGSKLPDNYEKQIAPYFGPMGWVLETEENGWRITGCVLKKKGVTEVVRKVGDSKTQR